MSDSVADMPGAERQGAAGEAGIVSGHVKDWGLGEWRRATEGVKAVE